MMAAETANDYDTVPYPGNSFVQTHPDRLATLGTLFGMQPTSVDRCRVLELGCGNGGNLIPMAFGLPQSEFVGIDLAAGPIGEGMSTVRSLGLRNITLNAIDLMNLSPELGTFDYIIAHGLYSWVPSPVQEKILSIFHANLGPQGIAYVSYNAYPGCHLRDIVRQILRYRTAQFPDPASKIVEARALVNFLWDLPDKTDAYWLLLREQVERVIEYSDALLYHDDLAEINTPVYFHDFMDRAATHSLQFLSESNFSDMQDRFNSPHVTEKLNSLAAGDIIKKEQYSDFLRCRSFRHTLLCHQGLELERELSPGRMAALRVASQAQPVSPAPNFHSDAIEEFRHPKGPSMSTGLPMAKAAVWELGRAWPESLTFAELLRRARFLIDPSNASDQFRDASILGQLLLKMYAAGVVEPHLHQPHFVLEVSPRPVASPVARLQVRTGGRITNLWHGSIAIEDSLGRRLLSLLDGAHDRAALVNDLAAAVESGDVEPLSPGGPIGDRSTIIRALSENIEAKLEQLARLALLVA
jgi:methyltransferase-like protein/2-polyprenyl-3-methyl-5-hydroxy-6-metoxy-1,4-benzoquinol methylase